MSKHLDRRSNAVLVELVEHRSSRPPLNNPCLVSMTMPCTATQTFSALRTRAGGESVESNASTNTWKLSWEMLKSSLPFDDFAVALEANIRRR